MTLNPEELRELVERLTTMYSHRGDGIPTQYVNPDGPAAADALTALSTRIEALNEVTTPVDCPICDGAAKAYKANEACIACVQRGQVWASTANILRNMKPHLEADWKQLASLRERIEALEAENARLRGHIDKPPRHKFWGAGDPDCPREIKAGNGELHTLRCKVCGLDNPRDDFCRHALGERT